MRLARGAGAALLLLAGLASPGCRGRREAFPRPLIPGVGNLASRADSAAAPLNASREPGALATVPAAPVAPWTGPGGRSFRIATRTSEEEAGHARRFGSITLETALRTRPLGQYPCTSCHLGRKIVMVEKRVGDAHQNVQPRHPEQTGALCSTCHAADNVEMLVLESGKHATLDESYRLCAQCHISQVDDWSHGAHGKRLDGWQGRRVVMACPDCHDPHNPAVQPRIPFRAPHIQRTRVIPR